MNNLNAMSESSLTVKEGKGSPDPDVLVPCTPRRPTPCARLLAGQVQEGSGFLKPGDRGLGRYVTKLEILGRVIKNLKTNKNNS